MGLFFTNLTMLAGLSALAAPILIHLLLKRKKQRLRFSTLQFFLRHDEHSSQRRKLRNLLLLAVRLLLLAVLVLAFARPFLPDHEAAGAGQKRRLAVFVVDRSVSMQALDGGSTRWEQAKKAMGKILGEMNPNDRAALISCASHCEVLSGAAPPEALARLLKELQPSYGSGNVAEGLQLAGKIISSAGVDSVSTIYVISDLQLSGCKNLADYPVPPEVEIKAIKFGDILTPNLAVTELRLDHREGERPHVVVASYSDERVKEAKIKLAIDGKETLSRVLQFATGTVARAELTLPPLAPGWHDAALRVEGDDALALDNVRYEAFFVPQPLRTLVVEPRQGARVFEEESFFVTSALDPMQGVTNSNLSRFVIEKVSPEELVKKLSPASGPSKYNLVMVPGLKQIPASLAVELLGFVRAGGGLILFLNDDINSGRYNSELRDLLPAQLGHLERNTSEAADSKWHLEDYDLKDAMFATFRRPGSGNLALPEFTRRCTLTTNQGSTVCARFGDETPAIVSLALGGGKVVLINSSADTVWTNWPKHKTYVPWLHGLCLSLTARAGGDQMRAAAHLIAGEDHDVSLGLAAKQQPFRVRRLGGKETIVTADPDGRLLNLESSAPGVYSITNAAGQEMQRLAINLPAEESELSALTPAEFQREVTRAARGHNATLAASFFGAEDHRKDFARVLLMAGLGLLLAETFLANRTYA